MQKVRVRRRREGRAGKVHLTADLVSTRPVVRTMCGLNLERAWCAFSHDSVTCGRCRHHIPGARTGIKPWM